jgi:NTP pyrophosphatase (non-canonical NTP hydrolase)
MLPLPDGATLSDVQRYVAEMEAERGFADGGVVEQCLHLGEEVGELFKAVRKSECLPVGTTSIVGTVDEELADILIFVCAIANRHGVDLSDALRRKEEHNERRVWA